jgi:hypothetical protein
MFLPLKNFQKEKHSIELCIKRIPPLMEFVKTPNVRYVSHVSYDFNYMIQVYSILFLQTIPISKIKKIEIYRLFPISI